MSDPKRIQRKRTKGWRMPDGAVYVGRPTKWGNPFRIVPGHTHLDDIFHIGDQMPCPSLTAEERRRELLEEAVARYRHWITHGLHVAVTTMAASNTSSPAAKSVVVWTSDPPRPPLAVSSGTGPRHERSLPAGAGHCAPQGRRVLPDDASNGHRQGSRRCGLAHMGTSDPRRPPPPARPGTRGGAVNDELRLPDDEYSTITREQWLRNEAARDEAAERGEECRRVEVAGYSGSRLG